LEQRGNLTKATPNERGGTPRRREDRGEKSNAFSSQTAGVTVMQEERE